MAERGLYGQAESDAGRINADAQRIADLEGEGTGTYEGVPTEQAYRQRMATSARKAIDAEQGERRELARPSHRPQLIRRMVVRHLRDDQRNALQEMADTAEEMKENGFDHKNVMTALTVATPMAYGQRAAERAARNQRHADEQAAGWQQARLRSKPRMYNPERDGLVNADGTPRYSSQTLAPIID